MQGDYPQSRPDSSFVRRPSSQGRPRDNNLRRDNQHSRRLPSPLPRPVAPAPAPAPVPVAVAVAVPVVDLAALARQHEDMKRKVEEKMGLKREQEAREEAEKQARLAAKLKDLEKRKECAADQELERTESRGDLVSRVSELDKRRNELMRTTQHASFPQKP